MTGVKVVTKFVLVFVLVLALVLALVFAGFAFYFLVWSLKQADLLREQQEQRDAVCRSSCRQFDYEGALPEGLSQIPDLLAARPGTCRCFNTLKVQE